MQSLLRKNLNLNSVGYRLKHVTAMETPISKLKTLFLGAVDSVKPSSMFERYLKDESVLRQLQLPEKNYHLVGFGKAVLGMAVQMERILGDRLAGGCISIPVGTLERFKGELDFQLNERGKIQVLECAANNLPDEAAVDAARKIQSIATSMTDRDVLCVLVSGGGSALLPLPKPPIDLNEKLTIIKQLASAGASIDELNVVRIQLSDVKGGKLAASASKSFKVLSFIISDIIGDPVQLIASGPTVQSNFSNQDALNILKKYNLVENLPKTVKAVLGSSNSVQVEEVKADIHLIGSNKIAIETVISKTTECDILALPMSTCVQGNVSDLSQTYFELATAIVKFRQNISTKPDFTNKLTKIFKTLNFDLAKIEPLTQALETNGQDLLLVSGGEPTVIVRGSGRGGRNQELALRFSLLCSESKDHNLLKDVLLLSAGTDGIDGPTDAAGAIGGAEVLERFKVLGDGRSVAEFIANNDSYSFYKQLEEFHVVTGHTGTNVMDVQMLYIPRKL